jgi:hypothetical protein
MTKIPPVPPASRKPHESDTDAARKGGKAAPKGGPNFDQQGQQGNSHQNTTHQGYQQDR